jgi:hypothetical protein
MNNKLLFISLFVLFFTSYSLAQVQVGFHHVPSSVFGDAYGVNSFINLGYQIGGRFTPELRVATNLDLEDFASGELALLYTLKKKEDMEVYTGFAPGYNGLLGESTYAIPIGMNFYPFETKQFGFHLEVAPQLIGEAATILRGSWGIRYRFGGE